MTNGRHMCRMMGLFRVFHRTSREFVTAQVTAFVFQFSNLVGMGGEFMHLRGALMILVVRSVIKAL